VRILPVSDGQFEMTAMNDTEFNIMFAGIDGRSPKTGGDLTWNQLMNAQTQ
jgi:hypothetical protein